jgi:glycosyltransferase 2 family protein
LALVPITLGYATAAIAWGILLSSFGVRAALFAGAGAYLAAQVGKYLPGNIGHYVGRVVLGARVGHPASTVALAMVFEFALLIAIAGLLSLPLLEFATLRLAAAWEAHASLSIALLVACVAIICIVPLVILRLRPTLLRSLKQWVMQLRAPFGSAASIARLAISASLSVAAIGLSSASLLIVGDPHQQFAMGEMWRVVSVYSVAWIVGALTPGLPGGIGVREAILVEGLKPLWGTGEAVAAALLFRVVSVAADIIALGIGLGAMRLSKVQRTPRKQAGD